MLTWQGSCVQTAPSPRCRVCNESTWQFFLPGAGFAAEIYKLYKQAMWVALLDLSSVLYQIKMGEADRLTRRKRLWGPRRLQSL